jgi:glutamate-1-semialdehyde 2,1-aminomutase
MTGFRVAYGGAQSLLNIKPDITTLGKIVGGGFPLAAYGGRAEIMEQILPAGKVFQAGTLSGNPMATAAGIETLKQLRDGDIYERLEKLGDRLAQGLAASAAKFGIPHQLVRVGSMMTLFFNSKPVDCWADASGSDVARYAKYFWGLIDRGVYMPCSQYEALFVSAAHTEVDIDETIASADGVLASIQA